MSATAPSRRSVWIPSEHGGWSLSLEPAILGSIIAPSAAAAALTASALVAFVLRTPLKLWLGDLWRGRRVARTPLAARAALVLAVVLALLLTASSLVSAHSFWLPLVAALPLFGVGIAFDLRGRGRRLIPELAGTVGTGSVAAAIVLAGGGSASLAAGVWAIVAARAVSSVPYVRVQLRRAKGQHHRVVASDLAQVAGAAIAVPAVILTPVPGPALLAVGAAIAWQLTSVRRPPPRAPVLGAQQVVVGLTIVLTTGLSVIAP